MGLYPGLVMPTIYPHQTLMMSPNIPAITHHHLPPFNYVNLVQSPQPQSLNTLNTSQMDFSDLLKSSKRKINQEDGTK